MIPRRELNRGKREDLEILSCRVKLFTKLRSRDIRWARDMTNNNSADCVPGELPYDTLPSLSLAARNDQLRAAPPLG